jgi:DNA mismatch repair ATPase MutS
VEQMTRDTGKVRLRKMDNFMDKLAQKFSAQEMIKANSQAEAEEMKRLQLQVSEYEKILQEMRKLNYRNTELADKLDRMIGDNADKIQGMKEDEQRLIAALRDLTDEQTRNREAEIGRKEEERIEQERAAENQKQTDLAAIAELLENKFQKSDDFVHKENVKVYRNVQAVVVDEIKRSTQSAQEERMKLKSELADELRRELDKKLNKVMVFGVISVAVSAVSVALWALMAMGVF